MHLIISLLLLGYHHNIFAVDNPILSVLSMNSYTINQQMLAAIKFGVSHNKVIWGLLNLASPPSMQCTINVIYVCWRDKY